jgi:putative membrane protein
VSAPDQPPPDPRSLLAERTLLAWLRTGLSLITFGFVIARIGIWLRAQPGGGGAGSIPESGWLGALFGVLGSLANLLAVVRYLAFRKAIFTNGQLPTTGLGLLSFATSVALMGAALSALVFARLL